jgi:peptidoglycan/LPS O-acetylase OafA/YrhL
MHLQTAAPIPHRHAGHGHRKALDGIRGLAILMVIGSHAFEANLQAAGPVLRTLGQVLFYGQFGVDLFFVLSGFLITGILLDTRTDQRFFRKFYARRTLRIFPLYYGVLLVLFGLTHPLHLQWHGLAIPLLLYLQNFFPSQINNFHLSPGIGLYHFWSLAIEEQFYLVWPAAVFLVRDRRTLFALTVTLSLASLLLRAGLLSAGAGNVMVHIDTFCRADSLVLGGALALLSRSSRWNRVLRLAPKVCLIAAALVLASTLALQGEIVTWCNETLRYTVLAIGFGGLIAWSLDDRTVVARLFRHPILGFLGKYSYGLYVLHVLVLGLTLLPLRSGILTLTHSKVASVALAGLIALGLSVGAAVLSYQAFEKPFLRLKRLFDYDPSPASSRPETLPDEGRSPIFAHTA